jgi:hypothetical protein
MMMTIYKTGGMNMTYRDRQRLRAAQARRTAPAETKWPETHQTLKSAFLSGFNMKNWRERLNT